MPLVLTRKAEETTVIFTETNQQILVTVQSISGDKVKLRFDAADNIDIWRDELLEDEAEN